MEHSSRNSGVGYLSHVFEVGWSVVILSYDLEVESKTLSHDFEV